MNAHLRSRLGLLAVALLLAGCAAPGAPASSGAPAGSSAASSAGASHAPSDLLASVEQRGGECPAAICDTTIYLDFDGRIHVSAKPPNDLGTATPAQVSALEAAIGATDFTALRKPAFSGQCPTAFDGQELDFQFTTATGTERLAACESSLDYGAPLFKALVAALGTAAPFKAAT